MTTKPLISLFMPDLRGGGAERVFVDLAKEFSQLGYKVEFVVMQAEGDFLEEVQARFAICNLNCKRVRQVVFALSRYLRHSKPDVMLVAMWPLTVIAPIVARLARFQGRTAITEHAALDIQHLSKGKLYHLAASVSMALGYRLAHKCVGVSKGVVQDMAKLSMIDESRFKVIYNPIRILSSPGEADIQETETLWGTRGPRVLTVGSFKAVKNHALLLRAFASIDRKDAKLMLVGQGDGEPQLRTLSVELNIADRVIFAGFHADPARFYRTADLFVLSSNHEGFGNVIVEALSCGLPVVSTDCPYGPAEILANGRYGRLTAVGDVKALASGITESLDNTHDRDALMRRASEFLPEIAALAYLKIMGLGS